MKFWLKKDNSSKFALPVTPESFEIKVNHNNKVVSIVSLGDINLLGKTGLKSVTLSSFFPSQDYNFVNVDRHSPMWYVEKIEKWRTSNTLIRFVIQDVINIECSIESFSWGMQDGTKDIYYTLDLKEYRTVSTKKRTIKSDTEKAKTYKIKKGDTLGKLAKKFYGKNSKANRNKIYNANKKIIKSKTKLPVGKTIKIPA